MEPSSWRREALKVPTRQPQRSRLWLDDGSCIRLRPARPNHVWSDDFVLMRTHDGRPLRLLVVIDEHSRRCLAIRVARRLTSDDVLEVLAERFVAPGTPNHLRSDNVLCREAEGVVGRRISSHRQVPMHLAA